MPRATPNKTLIIHTEKESSCRVLAKRTKWQSLVLQPSARMIIPLKTMSVILKIASQGRKITTFINLLHSLFLSAEESRQMEKSLSLLDGGIRASISGSSEEAEACCLSHAVDVDEFFSGCRERRMKSSLVIRAVNYILGCTDTEFLGR